MKQTVCLQDTRNYSPAYEYLRRKISEESKSDTQICAASEINTSILSKIKYDQKNRIELRIYVSICAGVNFSPSRTLRFLEAAGYKLQENIWEDFCYLEIIDHYAEKGDIEARNTKLKELGMPPSGYLGSSICKPSCKTTDRFSYTDSNEDCGVIAKR